LTTKVGNIITHFYFILGSSTKWLCPRIGRRPDSVRYSDWIWY